MNSQYRHIWIKHWLTVIVFFLGSLASALSVVPTSVTITNGSFEGLSGMVISPASLGLKTNLANLGDWQVTASGLLGFSSSVTVGTAAALGGPTPADGSYLAKISMPLGLGYMISLNEDLGQHYQAHSIYTLSVALDEGTVLGLFGNATLSLRAGTTTMASLSGGALVTLLDAKSGFQTVSFSYQTSAAPPSGDIDVYFEDDSLLSLGSSVYLDNFQLAVAPVPEPKPLALAGLFAAGLLLHFRRRKTLGNSSRRPSR